MADKRLVVLPSIHADDKIPDAVADHHKDHGVKRGMKHYEMLSALAKYHHYFVPED
jgi:hypothetical protein